jgi:hypothetical protein
MRQQKPDENVLKGLGDNRCHINRPAWPDQRGADGWHMELNSCAKQSKLKKQ